MPIELVDVALGDPPLGRSPEQVLQLVEALAAAPGGAGPLGDGIIAVMRSPSSREGSLERDAFRSGVAGVRLGDVPSMWLVEPDLLECLVMGACFHRDPAYVADIVGTQQSHSALLVALRLCALAGRTDVMRQLLCAKIRSYYEPAHVTLCGVATELALPRLVLSAAQHIEDARVRQRAMLTVISRTPNLWAVLAGASPPAQLGMTCWDACARRWPGDALAAWVKATGQAYLQGEVQLARFLSAIEPTPPTLDALSAFAVDAAGSARDVAAATLERWRLGEAVPIGAPSPHLP